MVERELRERRTLLPATQRLIDETEALTHRRVEVRSDPAIATRGRAAYIVSDRDRSRDLILYDPHEVQYLDHLIGHEIGHIRQFHDVPPADQTVPVTTTDTRTAAIEQLGPELGILLGRGIPAALLADVVPIWTSGTVAMLSDTPADVRIERWLFSEHPELRQVQYESLRAQARVLHRIPSPAVERMTPSSVWVASNAMNYVLMNEAATMFGDQGFTRPYLGDPGRRFGEELISLATPFESQTGLVGSRLVTDAWASRMEFSRWFEWRNLDSLAPNSPHAIE